MKSFIATMVAWLVFCALARAQGPDQQYVQIYNIIQTADSLQSSGQANQALTKYLEAQTALQRFQRGYPGWNSQTVQFRLNYLATKIAALSPTAPKPVPAPQPPARGPETNRAAATTNLQLVRTTPTPEPARSAPPSESETQLAAVKEQVLQLQADKALLDAKLKEALAAQPAAMDPRELAKAEERVKSLQKENELLKVSIDQIKARIPAAPAVDTNSLQKSQQALADINRKLTEQTQKADALALEKKALQNKLNSLANAPDPAALENAKKALDDANRKLAEQKHEFSKLSQEKEALQADVKASTTQAATAGTLREENQQLKKQMAQLKSPATPAKVPGASNQLALAQAKITTLETDREMLRLEKIALENRVKQLSGITPPANATKSSPAKPDDLNRTKQLEREVADLQKKLEVAAKQGNESQSKASSSRIEQLESQLTATRARLQVLEAKAIPYTPEELALFKNPTTKLAASDPNAGKKSIKDLPAGAGPLLAEAQRHFAAKRLDKAEEKYLQVLALDDKNVYTLANLAAIQLELGHMAEAEKHIQQSVGLDPGDAYSQTILGYLKFKQQKYDDSVDALSRAAQLDPDNAEVQNYLGLALSQKGQRGAAETALRKAIQLQPSYGSAHNNLAVIYLTQKPPAVELARWHYKKALAAGHPQNLALEKMLDATKAVPEPATAAGQ